MLLNARSARASLRYRVDPSGPFAGTGPFIAAATHPERRIPDGLLCATI